MAFLDQGQPYQVGPKEQSGYYQNPLVKEATPEDLEYLKKQNKVREHAAKHNQFQALTANDPKYGNWDAFSFTNIFAQILLPFLAPKYNTKASKSTTTGNLTEHWGSTVELPGLTLIALSEHRDVYPVVGFGRTGIKSFTTGNILHAGTLGFTIFDENPFANAIRAYAAWRGEEPTADHVNFTSPTELPPFDINLIFFNDRGDAAATQLIRSVKLIDSSKNISTNDVQLTDSYSFMAASVSNIISINKYARGLSGDNATTNTPKSRIIADLERLTAPNGNSTWNSSSPVPRSVAADNQNILDGSTQTAYNSANWTVGNTTVQNAIYTVSTSLASSAGTINNTVSVVTPYGTGNTFTWQPNLGIWKTAQAITLNVSGQLNTSVVWTASGSAPSGVSIAMTIKPNVVIVNPPPGLNISYSIYDSYRSSPFAVYTKKVNDFYGPYRIYPGSAPHFVTVTGSGTVDTEADWNSYTYTGSVTTSGNAFQIPQSYYNIEISLTPTQNFVDSINPTIVYVENKITLS